MLNSSNRNGFLCADKFKKALKAAFESLPATGVIRVNMKVESGKVTAYRTRVSLSFKTRSLIPFGQHRASARATGVRP